MVLQLDRKEMVAFLLYACCYARVQLSLWTPTVRTPAKVINANEYLGLLALCIKAGFPSGVSFSDNSCSDHLFCESYSMGSVG